MAFKKDLTAGTYEGDDIPKTTKWVYSVSGMFRDALYALVSGFLLNYIMYSGVLSSDPAEYSKQIGVINILFIVFLIWDGINDPLFGIILEKCHLKSGKFRPWILIGGVLNSIVVALLFSVRPTGWAFVAYWAVFYFLWDGVFTLNDIGYWSMLPSMTSDEKKRKEVTTLMSIFVSLGSFSMYAICSLLPTAANYSYIYTWIAIISCVLFGLSQIAVFFFCKEKKRDPKQEEISEKTTLKDLFLVVKKNKPLRASVIAILVYYTGSSMMIGFGMTYFYIVYGYGGHLGGSMMTLFTVMYVLGTLVSQFLFGFLSKKFKKQTLLTWSCFITVGAYAVMFLIGVPLFGTHPLAYNSTSGAADFAYALGGTSWMLYIPPVIFFAGEGVFYLVLLMMMQNSIEYNEWKFGERRESVVFSWRPLDAKFGGAIQKGLIYLTLVISGLYEVTGTISNKEQDIAALSNEIRNGGLTEEQIADANQQITELTAEINQVVSDTPQSKQIIMGIGMIGSIILCMIAAWAICHWGYKLDEEEYTKIVGELAERHKADEAAAAAPEPALAVAGNAPTPVAEAPKDDHAKER
jgi:Na+/melibiose symporter-like transporter